jgi:hypothetical protein
MALMMTLFKYVQLTIKERISRKLWICSLRSVHRADGLFRGPDSVPISPEMKYFFADHRHRSSIYTCNLFCAHVLVVLTKNVYNLRLC